MSLLLQALQKAAKSREEGEVDLAAADELSMADELELEPTPVSPRAPQEPASAPTSAQAATLVQAASVPAFDPMDYVREHYMLAIVGAAVLVALAYGSYVYVQVNHPFRSSSPAASPVAIAPPAPQAPAQNANASSKISGLPGGGSSATPVSAGGAIDAAPAPGKTPAAVMPSATPVAKNPAETTMAVNDRADEPAAPPTGARNRAPLKLTRVPAAKAARQDDSAPLVDASDSIETVVVPTSHAKPAAEAKPAGDIMVRKDGASVLPISPTLMQAYETLQSGDRPKAKALYEQVLQADSRNMDALLGLGSISLADGRIDDASRYYQQVLELDPRNSYAQAGLISIIGGADLQASESRLKQLIARDPSAFLYFSLGNLYAEQSQWPSAQQAYFQAYQMQSDNPDYAFNLAVGLEHVGQSRLALEYYRKALDLSFKKGRANFDQSLVIQRVGQLSTRVEQ